MKWEYDPEERARQRLEAGRVIGLNNAFVQIKQGNGVRDVLHRRMSCCSLTTDKYGWITNLLRVKVRALDTTYMTGRS